jgi:hypothetical protein
MAAVAGDTLVSLMSDNHDAPLDANVFIESAEYARLMRGMAPQDGGSAAPVVSAFNSSI